jgi:hypothetical protein
MTIQAKAKEMFQKGSGDWTQYRSTFGLSKRDEVDLHFGRRDRVVSYEEAMAELINIVVSRRHNKMVALM